MKKSIKVLKFGGSSLSTVEAMHSCARLIKSEQNEGEKLVVVVSAMGSQTDELLKLAFSISKNPEQRELDMLLSTGERVSCSLLAMALKEVGLKALSLTGSQCGILTDKTHQHAEIIEIKCHRVFSALESNDVVLVAGFQGVDPISKEITTLGRGGSDLTAVSLAHRLEASDCKIFTDVNGILTLDPREFSEASTAKQVSWSVAYKLSYYGAQVLHYRASLCAQKNKIPLQVINTNDPKGKKTVVTEFEGSENFICYKKNQSLLRIQMTKKVDVLFLENLTQFLWTHDETPGFKKREAQENSICFWFSVNSSVINKVEKFLKSYLDFLLSFDVIEKDFFSFHLILSSSQDLKKTSQLIGDFISSKKTFFFHEENRVISFSAREKSPHNVIKNLYKLF